MILNVEPGGWGPVVASPLSASTAPSRGRSDGDAAEPVAERGDRRALQAGPDRRVHGAAAARLGARRSGALPNSSTALGRPASRSL